MGETRKGHSVEAMKKHSRRLHEKTQRLDNGVERASQSDIVNFILSALMLFCLGMWGCEAQEDTPTVIAETSAGGVRRTEWILKSQPTVVILELGVNDRLRGLPLQETYRNLHTII